MIFLKKKSAISLFLYANMGAATDYEFHEFRCWLFFSHFVHLFYQRLIKMNMPIMGDNTVLFTSTLFALIRTALGIFSTGDPAYADSELRRTIKKLWPKTSKKILDKMIPLQSG